MVTKLERTSLSAQMYVHTRFEKTSPSVHSISHEQKKENRYFHIIKIILPLVGCTFSIPPQALLFSHVSVPSRNGAAEPCLNNTLPQKEENKCKSEPLIPVQDFVTINRKRQEVDQT